MTTHMAREVAEIPAAAARLAEPAARGRTAEVAARLAALDPPALVTAARGSSDHAANVWAYAAQIATGRPVASMGPSVASVWGARLRVGGLASLTLSQSGRSADITALTAALREGGALTVAIVNTPGSPVAEAAEETLDAHAGPEHAVAATKSVTNSLLAGLWLLALWRGDAGLVSALERAPDALADALARPHEALAEALSGLERLTVIGRGPSLGIAAETALKGTEACGLAASAWSGAEVLHGPAAALGPGDALLVVPGPGTEEAVARLTARGVRLLPGPPAAGLHPLLDPLLALPPIYAAVEAAARAGGRDPDRPDGLAKETITV